MTFPFYEEIINDGTISIDNFKYPNFMGYLNPYGIPISFKDKFGYTGHGEGLSLQERFRVYYRLKIKSSEKMNLLEEYRMSDKYQKSERDRYSGILKILKEEKEQRKRQFYFSELEQMELEVYNFLLKCYNAETFFKGVGNVETCMCEYDFWEREYKNKKLYDMYHNDFELEYGIYIDKILVEVFKKVMIQYLGYHAVERVPKTITTSSFRIYETFYQYIDNGFTIFQIPKMIFEPKEKKYVQCKQNEFFIPDSELRLRDELLAHRKLVLLNK